MYSPASHARRTAADELSPSSGREGNRWAYVFPGETCLRRWRLAAALLTVALCLLPRLAHAQGDFGVIEGTVVDEQGSALPGVTITLQNEASGVSRSVVTEADGRYRVPAIPPGRYLLKAELTGFAVQQVKDIEITIGLGLKQDFAMKVQSVQETVTVVGAQPIVDVTRSEVAGVVTQQQIETLPINSRQYLALALLMPGTSQDATRSFFATVNVGGSMTFNSTGNVVDGMINNFVEDGEPRQDFAEDAVQEFKVSNVVVQGRVRPGHRRRGPGRDQVGQQRSARQRVRVLPRQEPERQGRLRDGQARLPPAISSAAAWAARSSQWQVHFFGVATSAPASTSSTPSGRGSRSSTPRWKARSCDRPTAICTSAAWTARSTTPSRCSCAMRRRTRSRPARGAAARSRRPPATTSDAARRPRRRPHLDARQPRAQRVPVPVGARGVLRISRSGTEIWTTVGDFPSARINRRSRSTGSRR